MKKKLRGFMLQTIAIVPLLCTIALSTPCKYLTIMSSGWTGQLKRCYTFTWGVSYGITATVSYERCEYVAMSGFSGMITMNKAKVDLC